MFVTIRQSAEDIPPVGDYGDKSGDCSAWFEVLRHESAPAILILVFVEVVFTITSVSVDLLKCSGIEFIVVCDKCAAIPVSSDLILYEVELRLNKRKRTLLDRKSVV